MTNIIYGVVESVEIRTVADKELWSFQIKDQHGNLLKYDSLIRHYPDPIISDDITIVDFKGDVSVRIQISIPKREVVESILKKEIFKGKCATILNEAI